MSEKKPKKRRSSLWDMKLKTNTKDTIVLAKQCDDCNGDGDVLGKNGKYQACNRCKGLGHKLTTNGYEILMFIQKFNSEGGVK